MVQLTFAESMKGWAARGAEDFDAGCVSGKRAGTPLSFDVSITAEDLEAVTDDPATPCRLEGVVHAPELSDEPLEISEGRFRLMVPDLTRTETMHMRYEMLLIAADGIRYRFDGFKVIRTEPPWRAWPATTTMFVTISDEHATPVCRGIITIGLRDFLRLLRSMEASGASWMRGVRARSNFGRMFLGRLVRRYAGALDLLGRYREDETPAVRALTVAEPTSEWRDGAGAWHVGIPPTSARDANLKLTRYQGGSKGPVLLAPGFGMNAASFSLPTVDTTLVEFLYDAGYDVWLFDYRASIDLPSCHTSFDIDAIALEDWPAAVDRVRAVAGVESVQLLGHCVGSVTIMMAILGGMEGVRSAVCSQFTVHPRPGWLNRVKNTLHVGEVLEMFRLRGVDDTAAPTLPNKALDVAMAVLPVPRGEQCGRPVCRWLNATYGLTHTHTQLNEATHEMLDDAFGFGNLRGIKHLARMHRLGRAVDANGEDRYLPHVDRLSMPVLLLQGSMNPIFRPSGTRTTLRWLEEHHGTGLHSYLEFEDYSHLDTMIGARAAQDIFPAIVEHFDATNA